MARRMKVWLGSALLLGAFCAAAAFALSPAIAEPAQRVGRAIASGLVAEDPADVVLPVETLEGVTEGAPIYHLATGHERVPVAHVVRTTTTAGGPALCIRFRPGFDGAGPWRAEVHPPRRGLADSFRLAVPPETARRVGEAMRERIEVLWREEIAPSLAERLPAFLDRIDPRHEGGSRTLLKAFGDDAMKRMRPLMDELLKTVTHALEESLDFRDRMSVLWKFVRGDGRGIRRKVQPTAERAATAWWAANQDKVLGALGDAFQDQLPDIRRWLETDVLEAAREELFVPLLETHRERLEEEGEALVRLGMKEIVESDEGGFRVRFAAMLRMTLLGKRRALILITR